MSGAHGVDPPRRDPLRGIPLEALRGFEAAARLLNFTRAAEELRLTQSAVSREIRTLEERVGTRLFERTRGGLRLTRAGLALQTDVAAALATMRRGIERASGGGARKPILIVGNRSMVTDWLWDRVEAFHGAHPGIELRIAYAPRTGAPGERRGVDDIDATEIDLGIRLLPRAEADGRFARLFTEYVFPCCTQALAQDAARPLRALADLARHTLLELDDGMQPLDANWPVWCERAGIAPIEPAAWTRVPDWALLFALARQSRGVCLGRMPCVNDALRSGLLIAPIPDATLSTRAFYLVQSTRSKADPSARAFVEWLQAEAQREEAFAQSFLASKGVRGA
jgi:LysR family transcriptional regulator, glycine cleavage system transcriptional activator